MPGDSLTGLVLATAVIAALVGVVALVLRRVAARDRADAEDTQVLETQHMRARHASKLPGASPERPIEVRSPAVIEPRAEALPCPECGAPGHVETHVVEEHPSGRLRVATVRCRDCGHRRPVYMRLPLAN